MKYADNPAHAAHMRPYAHRERPSPTRWQTLSMDDIIRLVHLKFPNISMSDASGVEIVASVLGNNVRMQRRLIHQETDTLALGRWDNEGGAIECPID